MTDISRTILNEYQVRKSKKQKTAFIELLRSRFPELQVQAGGSFGNRNIIIGDIKRAKVVFTAHYDTCAVLPIPNFIAPKNPLLSILYSILQILPILLITFLLNLFVGIFTDSFWLHYWLTIAAYVGIFILMLAGPANKHTANDNTSGVITLCELLCSLSDVEREKAAFVFFDNEEIGLIGSNHFRKSFKKEMKHKLLINFDCVSDGSNLLLAVSKHARNDYENAIAESFRDTEDKVFLIEKAEKIYYPSDQMGFKSTVAVAALKHKPVIGYYLDRIHTPKDTVFDEENIDLLVHCAHRFLANI